jgi:hypothetical protein
VEYGMTPSIRAVRDEMLARTGQVRAVPSRKICTSSWTRAIEAVTLTCST